MAYFIILNRLAFILFFTECAKRKNVLFPCHLYILSLALHSRPLDSFKEFAAVVMRSGVD